MNWTQTVRMALKSILNNKIRSLLTMLGIIIGVASVIAIVASIQGTTKLQRLQYEAMGANRIDVYAWGAKTRTGRISRNILTRWTRSPHGRRSHSTGTGRTAACSTAARKWTRTARTTAIFRCISSTNTTAR